MNYSQVIGSIGRASANDEINNSIEIVVYINETLDGVTRKGLLAAILKDRGVFSAEFCPLRYHLLLVQYDGTRLDSRDILSKVVALNFSARIVGTI
jgi:hypothetical protein